MDANARDAATATVDACCDYMDDYYAYATTTTTMTTDGWTGGWSTTTMTTTVIHARCGGDVASKASAGRTRRAMSWRCARATSRASASAARGHSGNVHTAWMMYAVEYIANAMMA
jgi:hypothetical protein